jgi:proteasome assembly chaperone (PAC2) family protein
MNFIKSNVFNFIVLILLTVILLQRCNGRKDTYIPPSIKRDTVWVVKDSLITSKPSVIKTIQVTSHDTIINHYIPDTNYNKLVGQYQEIVKELLAKNIHLDSIRIDTNGYVKITDTVQKNLIIGRTTEVKLKYPVIKETITIHQQPKNQLYIGGGIGASQNAAVNQVRIGALFKTKKDQLFGANVGISTQGTIVYGIDSYWKLKIK